VFSDSVSTIGFDMAVFLCAARFNSAVEVAVVKFNACVVEIKMKIVFKYQCGLLFKALLLYTHSPLSFTSYR